MRYKTLIFALLLTAAGSAQAGFLGQQFDATYYFPDTATPYASGSFTPATFVVGAGIETVGDIDGVTELVVDFEDTTLTVTLSTILTNPSWNAADFNGILFSLLSPGNLDIASLSIDAASTVPGFDAGHVEFSDTSLGINWSGLSYVSGDIVKINFEFNSTTPPRIPAPGTLALAGISLLGLGLSRVRRSSRRGSNTTQ